MQTIEQKKGTSPTHQINTQQEPFLFNCQSYSNNKSLINRKLPVEQNKSLNNYQRRNKRQNRKKSKDYPLQNFPILINPTNMIPQAPLFDLERNKKLSFEKKKALLLVLYSKTPENEIKTKKELNVFLCKMKKIQNDQHKLPTPSLNRKEIFSLFVRIVTDLAGHQNIINVTNIVIDKVSPTNLTEKVVFIIYSFLKNQLEKVELVTMLSKITELLKNHVTDKYGYMLGQLERNRSLAQIFHSTSRKNLGSNILLTSTNLLQKVLHSIKRRKCHLLTKCRNTSVKCWGKKLRKFDFVYNRLQETKRHMIAYKTSKILKLKELKSEINFLRQEESCLQMKLSSAREKFEMEVKPTSSYQQIKTMNKNLLVTISRLKIDIKRLILVIKEKIIFLDHCSCEPIPEEVVSQYEGLKDKIHKRSIAKFRNDLVRQSMLQLLNKRIALLYEEEKRLFSMMSYPHEMERALARRDEVLCVKRKIAHILKYYVSHQDFLPRPINELK